MGECRAIRAILYFDMIRLLGNIPLLSEPATENMPPAHLDEVSDFISDYF